MFLSKIKINGFRNFKNTEISFNDGINVIIGHNNAGKTNLLKALSLVIDYQSSKRLLIDDFNKNIIIDDLKANPPAIVIEVTITQSDGEDLNSDDLVTVGNWLTVLNTPYESRLTYIFALPEREKGRYLHALTAAPDTNTAWKIIQHDFVRLYTYKIFGGDANLQVIADSESLQKFDFQFLNAIRDVERDMLTGRNTLLRDVLDFFMDYDIKSDSAKSKEDKEGEIKQKKHEFSIKSDDLLLDLQQRMHEGKKHILSYATATGASFDNTAPSFEGSISDVEMFSALKLIVEHETGIKIPASHNGLGYNNLIFMSLLLAKMQVNSDGEYLGSNAKVFPILAIEEPEAHLHPAMQYKFLKFMKRTNDVTKKVRQVFVTTHSTQITSAVSLDEIICLHNENGETSVAYPGKVFPDDKSKKYVQRFLDATKSDMLFAQKVILVEGIAEQLLLSILANYCGKSLEDNHVAIINVGGRYFDHFLHLFDSLNSDTIPKKIACLTDKDPERKKIVAPTTDDKKFKQCYPFEFNQDSVNYAYKSNQSGLNFSNHPNIHFFTQDSDQGKTFEYDIILHNPDLELLVTESISNKTEIKSLMKAYNENKTVDDLTSILGNSKENTRIRNSIQSNVSWNDEEKRKAIIAARYLNSVGKGENALELAYVLENNLSRNDYSNYVRVPAYVKEAIEWICQ